MKPASAEDRALKRSSLSSSRWIRTSDVHLGRFHGQDGELVPAQPADDVGLPEALLQDEGDLGEGPVAHLVPAGVVDLLEVVDVEVEEGDPLLQAAGGLELLLGQGHEAAAVVERRQLVVKGQGQDLLLHVLPVGDVGQDGHRPAELGALDARAAADEERAAGAVLVQEDELVAVGDALGALLVRPADDGMLVLGDEREDLAGRSSPHGV